ncbi:GIY-YIG nuclease family protein [Streptomyces sp. NPDC005349]|uniref:GIY-YIG nuclease family protein n=1 Tax=Streptomyces sp. NPDC005349 TaxID=3157037 RepID=UPI0033A85F45
MPELLRDHLASAARPLSTVDLLQGPHDDIVYFIAHRDRVKIGFTSNLKKRVNALALRPDSILLALDGGLDLERALHTRFASARVADTEWFENTSEIRDYIATRDVATLGPARRIPLDTQRRPTPERSSTEAERAALLTDLAEVLGDEPRMRTREALHRLVEHSPAAYRSWTFRDLTQVLRAANASPRTYQGFPVVDRQSIHTALAARQSQ